MNDVSAFLGFQIKRRMKDGFAVGYNVILPLILIALLGVLTRNNFGSLITSYQYYTIVLIPFCCVMSLITASYATKEEAYAKTAIRILMSPLEEGDIVKVKIMSCTLVFTLCNGITFLIASLIWNLPIGPEWLLILLLLGSLSYVVSAIGVIVGVGMKNFLLVKNIINLPIALMGAAAGAFYPIGTLHPVLQVMMNLSWLTWVNRSIFALLYDHKMTLIVIVIVLQCLVGTVCMWVAEKAFQKGEYLNGDLPGYKE